MRKSRFCWICLTMMIMTGLTGCGNQIPDMTEEQRTAISEYAVDLLLKYDTNQSNRLVDLSELEEEPEAMKPPKPVTTEPPAENVGMDETEDTPVIDLNGEASFSGGNMKATLGLDENISIDYTDYQMLDKYVDVISEDLVIEAAEGKKLLVCEFVLMNDGSDKQSVDMLRENIQYALSFDEQAVNCLVTMLSNDLTTYLGILEPDESRKVVVITEVEETRVTNSAEILLIMQRGDSQATVKIK